MDDVIITIETKMEKEDYRKFLYIATFRRNPIVLPMIALISLAGTILVTWRNDTFAIFPIFILWILMFSLAVGVICFKVERKNKQRIVTDNTGTFGSTSILKFYSDHLTMETPATQARYKQC